MADWRALGHTADGLRTLMLRQHRQRGLESYAAYALEEAAARLQQLEAALVAAGVTVPAPAPADKNARAIEMARLMTGLGHEARSVHQFVWGQWGEQAVAAVIASTGGPKS